MGSSYWSDNVLAIGCIWTGTGLAISSYWPGSGLVVGCDIGWTLVWVWIFHFLVLLWLVKVFNCSNIGLVSGLFQVYF